MLEGLFSWLLLPLGVLLGWTLARRAPDAEAADGSEQLGGLLTQLDGADPDQAIAALTGAAPNDEATAELHLTLGNLFRKRGEVDRALRIHEALLTREQVSMELRDRARFELAQDYLKAGLIDRAQQLFEELASQGRHVAAALEQIVAIYEQGRDWRHAIEAARRLQGAKGDSRQAVIAQYYCELAEEARQQKKFDEAESLAKDALGADRQCVRAHLLLGALHQQQQDYTAAVVDYRKAFDTDGRFLSEVLKPIGECYEKAGDAKGYLTFLSDAKEVSPSSLPVVAEARLMKQEGMDPMSHLAAGLEARPSRAVLVDLLEVLEKRPEVIAAKLDKPAASLRGAILKFIETTPRYRCTQCGFAPRQQFWQCPTCKQWGTVAPVEDVLKPGG